jgi:hypothetical protein
MMARRPVDAARRVGDASATPNDGRYDMVIRRSRGRDLTRYVDARPAHATGVVVNGPSLRGPLALASMALGAGAIGALAIGRLAIGQASIKRLAIEELCVGRLQVSELEVARETRPAAGGGGAA